MMEITVCPNCKKEFKCQPRSQCWCFFITISPEVKEFITGKFEGCLCADCLKEFENDTEIKKGSS